MKNRPCSCSLPLDLQSVSYLDWHLMSSRVVSFQIMLNPLSMHTQHSFPIVHVDNVFHMSWWSSKTSLVEEKGAVLVTWSISRIENTSRLLARMFDRCTNVAPKQWKTHIPPCVKTHGVRTEKEKWLMFSTRAMCKAMITLDFDTMSLETQEILLNATHWRAFIFLPKVHVN